MPRNLYENKTKYYASGQHKEQPEVPGLLANAGAQFMQQNIKDPLEGILNTIGNAPTRTAQLAQGLRDPKILLANLMQKKEYAPKFRPHEMMGTDPNAPITSPEGAAQFAGGNALALLGLGQSALKGAGAIAGGAEEGGLFGGIRGGGGGNTGGGGGGSILSQALNHIKKIEQAPEAKAKELLESPHAGAKGGAELNRKRVAETVQSAHDNVLAKALQERNKVIDVADGNDILAHKPEKLPEGNITKMAVKVAGKENLPDAEQTERLAKALTGFRKNADEPNALPKFADKFENILGLDNPLTEKQMDELEHMLSVPTHKDSAYLKNNKKLFETFDSDLNSLHSKYAKNTNFTNADDLLSELKSRKRSFETDPKLTRNDVRLHVAPYDRAIKDLQGEMHDYLDTLPPEIKESWKSWNKQYAENVLPYRSNKVLRDITHKTKNGPRTTENLKSSQIKALFSEPGKDAQKILSHIPQEGKDWILLNELSSPTYKKDPNKLLAKLKTMKAGGYSKLFTPEWDQFVDELENAISEAEKMKNRKGAVKDIAMKLGGGAAIGHPVGGLIWGLHNLFKGMKH